MISENKFRSAWLLSLVCLWVVSAVEVQAAEQFRALVFSRTLLFRHASITNGIAAIKKLGEANHFDVEASEDAALFTSTNLSKYKVIVLLSTSGEIFNLPQKAALKNYVETGGGLACIHAAVAGDLATEGSWAWYTEALCARFTNHSSVVGAAVRIEDRQNPSTATLPLRWERSDEWYNFIRSPRGQVRVLASLDESTYSGGTMGKDHPVVWCRKVGKGRVWYTALGHTEASYCEPLFLDHILGGIRLAAGVAPGSFEPE